MSQPDSRVDAWREALRRGIELLNAGRLPEAITVFDGNVESISGDVGSAGEELLADSLFGRARALRGAGRLKEAAAAFGAVVDRFGDAHGRRVHMRVMESLAERAEVLLDVGDLPGASASADTLREVFFGPSAADLFGGVLNQRAVVWFSRATRVKAHALERSGRLQEATALYDELTERFSGGDTLPERSVVGSALHERARLLRKVGLIDEALVADEHVLSRYGDCEAQALRRIVTAAHMARLGDLGQLERWESQIVAIAEFLTYAERHPLPNTPAPEMAAHLIRIQALRELDRTEEALTCTDALLERYGETPVKRELILNALLMKARILAHQNRWDEAIGAADEVLVRIGEDPDPELRFGVLRALATKLRLLVESGRPTEACVISDALASRIADEGGVELLTDFAPEAVKASRALFHFGEYPAAASVLEAVSSQLRETDEPRSRRGLARCLADLIRYLALVGRAQEAIEATEELMTLGVDALPALDEMIKRDIDADGHPTDDQLALTLLTKATVLARLDRPDEAAPVFAEVIDRFHELPNEKIRMVVSAARHGLAGNLDDAGVDLDELL